MFSGRVSAPAGQSHPEAVSDSSLEVLTTSFPVSRPARDGFLHSSGRDSLTNAYSRGGFDACLHDEILRARSRGTCCVVAVLDIDHFKSINDAYGHLRGDQVLRDLVQYIQRTLRDTDRLFRLGGDEFVLILSLTQTSGALVACQRIVDGLKTTVFPGEPELTLSISMGIATFPDDATDARRLMQTADRRCYQAKRQGRGRFVASDTAVCTGIDFDPQGRLIERDDALDRLQSVFGAVEVKGRGVLAIQGHPGTGRSCLLAQAVKTAEMRGYTVVSLRGQRRLRHRPYAAFQNARWPQPFSISAGPDPLVLALERWMQETDKTRLLVAVDDFDELDRLSAELLRTIFDRLSVPQALLIYTAGPEPVAAIRSTEHLVEKQVTLAPLSLEGMRVWLRIVLRWEPPEHFCRWLYELTHGFPALVRRQLTRLVAEGVLTLDHGGTHALRGDYAMHVSLAESPKPSCPATNLPATLTDFIGREPDHYQLDQLLDSRRLITLVGPGGVGKTRLAIEAAQARLEVYPDGVWFVALEALRLPELIAPAIARTLGFKESPGQSLLETLKASLKHKSLLLVLDNFEQLLEGTPLLTELLEAAPELQILATSRERLNLLGEHVFPLQPLSVPDLGQLPECEQMTEYSSVNLFVNRARAVDYRFALAAANLRAVAEIAVRLDGLPLAIELAAARMDVFSPEELAAQLIARLEALGEGPRNLTTRQRTLRGAIDWGYGLLAPVERVVFARLGVFSGAFSLEAAKSIAGDVEPNAAGEVVAPAALPKLLTSLAEKSLLRQTRQEAGRPRWTMLETLREYALERLAQSEGVQPARQRHVQYYLALVEQAASELTGPNQPKSVESFGRELDNIRAALSSALEQGAADQALRFAEACWRFWQVQGYHTEGRSSLDRVFRLARAVLASPAPALQDDGMVSVLRQRFARSLCGAGWLSHDNSDYTSALRHFEESLEIAQAVGDRHAAGMALQGVGRIDMLQGNLVRARRCFEEAQSTFAELGNQEELAWAASNLGQVLRREGDLQGAEECYTRSLSIFREIRQVWGIATALPLLAGTLLDRANPGAAKRLLDPQLGHMRETGDTNGVLFTWGLTLQGEAELALGNLERAERILEECGSICRERAYSNQVAYVEECLGRLCLERGESAPSRRHFRDSLVLQHSLGDSWALIRLLERVAVLIAREGKPLVATQILGSTNTARSRHGVPRGLGQQQEHDEVLGGLQHRLEEADFTRAWREGQAMTEDQTAKLALAHLG
jgi:diguanylate cyclase (GGDEF)-like protein